MSNYSFFNDDAMERHVENYRLISLLGTDYKVVEKLLSTRLPTLLGSYIHPDQTNFVRGRCIRDSVQSIFDLAD